MSLSYQVEVLNTSILTAVGSYELVEITLDEAKALVRQPAGFESAVGHESTAQILTTLLGVEVPMNRIFFQQQAGQEALVFKLNGRPPEGTILTAEEITAIGYSFMKLTRTA
jgi:hypothetical protein